MHRRQTSYHSTNIALSVDRLACFRHECRIKHGAIPVLYLMAFYRSLQQAYTFYTNTPLCKTIAMMTYTDKFREHRSNRCWDIAIFAVFKMADATFWCNSSLSSSVPVIAWAAEASEKWACQINSRFTETTSGANHDFEGAWRVWPIC